MKRTLYLALVAAATLAVAGIAFAGSNCTKTAANAGSACCAKTATAQADAKAGDCAAACAAAGKTCTPAQAAACEGQTKTAASAGSACTAGQAQMADCSYCAFMGDLHANAGKVKFSAEETEHGMVIVFAAVSQDDVPTAQAVAAKAYDMMSKPAACAVTRAKMADSSCDGCKKGLDAFAKATVTMEETKDGSKAMVSTEDDATVEQLHAFFRNLQAHANQG